jgi:hypothetical protein
MSLCRNILEGTPTFINVPIMHIEASERYHGQDRKSRTPLWTTWFRPLRTQRYSRKHDDIYLAREDGTVLFIENNASEIADIQMEIALDCNIDTAFACLDKHGTVLENEKHGDRLIVGGDACNGGLYLLEARKPVRKYF